jgi:hypothetical protein
MSRSVLVAVAALTSLSTLMAAPSSHAGQVGMHRATHTSAIPLPRPRPDMVWAAPGSFFAALAAVDAAIERVSIPALDAQKGWFSPATGASSASAVATADAFPCRMKDIVPEYATVFEAACTPSTNIAAAKTEAGDL